MRCRESGNVWWPDFVRVVAYLHKARRDALEAAIKVRKTRWAIKVVRSDQLDYEVLEDGRPIGRIYEDLHALSELLWFWSITVFVGDRPGVTTNGRAPTLELAKARFLENWRKCGADSLT